MDHLGMGLVLMIESSVLAAGGTVIEVAASAINQKRHPILRTISEVFAKTLQSAPAAFSLCVIGSLNFPSALVGTMMLLTPLLNGIIQNSPIDSLKKGMDIADRTVSITAKIINTSLLTLLMSGAEPFAAVLIGMGISSLNYLAYKRLSPSVRFVEN